MAARGARGGVGRRVTGGDQAVGVERRAFKLVAVAGEDAAALDAAAREAAARLRASPAAELGRLAAALRRDGPAPRHRRMVVCREPGAAIAALTGAVGPGAARVWSGVAGRRAPAVSFLFSGVGDQYPGMAHGLYRQEPVFRAAVDRCAEILVPWLGRDVREVLFAPAPEAAAPPGEAGAAAGHGGPQRRMDLRQMLGRSGAATWAPANPLDQTLFVHPALFTVEYALAQLWMSWGVVPRSLAGYSVGEYVAACLAGVFELAQALRLVAVRARILDELPAGAMLSIFLPEADCAALLGEGLWLAAVNGPSLCVVAGESAAVEALASRLQERRVPCRRLAAGHAFHSPLLAPAVAPLVREAAALALRPPAVPLLSNVSGGWIGAAEATDPEYWARHMCRPVRFAAALATLGTGAARALVEIGPGSTLCSMALQGAMPVAPVVAVPSLPHAQDAEPDLEVMVSALGRLWLAGVEPDWRAFDGEHLGTR